MWMLHRRRGMTRAAAVGLFRRHRDIAGAIVIFDGVTGNAATFHRRMNVVSDGVVGVALDAIRVLVNPRRVRARIAQLRTEDSAKE